MDALGDPIGQGTWYVGDRPERRAAEIAALHAGLEAGLRVIDTAEMYGSGRSEELVGAAIAGRRDEVFLVDKVLPHHASRAGTVAACEASLRRLGTDRIDLYLLHWPGHHPLEDTVAGLTDLIERGLIGAWGVSNFDPHDLAELFALGVTPAANQILYNPTRRGVEFDLLPLHRERGIATMAYSPIEQGRLLGHPTLAAIAAEHGATTAQVALAWCVRDGVVQAIPKASDPAHTRENAAARELRLSAADLAAIDAAFPPPSGPEPLEML